MQVESITGAPEIHTGTEYTVEPLGDAPRIFCGDATVHAVDNEVQRRDEAIARKAQVKRRLHGKVARASTIARWRKVGGGRNATR